MKTLISISSVLLLSAGSLFASVQADEQTSNPATPLDIKTLEAQLAQANYDLSDRNTRLRLERAQYYYHSSVQHLDAGWKAKALDQAQRGLNLLALQNRVRVGTPVVNM